MGMNLTGQAQAVAEAFVAARREARALESYPGERPYTLGEAYRINPPDDGVLGTNRLAGPIFADSVVRAEPGDEPDMPVFTDGFAAAEAEMLLHVAPGWNGRLPTDDAETRALLDDVRLGIEVASSPYPGINADGPLVTTSDFGNNAGLVIGAALTGWQAADLCAIPVRTVIDGVVIGEATAATMLDGPFGAVRFLLANLQARGLETGKGLWVSTGAITGVHPVRPGARVVAEFAGHGAVRCRIVPAQPR